MGAIMIKTAADVVWAVLAGRPSEPVGAEGEAFAASNIALCKYWGKRNEALNLPVTSSLSMSLGKLGSHVRLRHGGTVDRVTLNGTALEAESGFVRRVSCFLDLFRPQSGDGFDVDARNTVPTAAGFASSASGFAALVLALNRYFGWSLSPRDLSILARLGSGSACRSVFDGFVEWHAGCADDGMDSFAEPLGVQWPELRIALLVLTDAEKGVGSRVAMQRTVTTSALYSGWPRQVADDLRVLRAALTAHDLATLGCVAERNALAMHATMMAADPPVLYWLPDSVRAMRQVWALRSAGVPVYFTMDAGPNVKLLYLDEDESAIVEAFAGDRLVRPHR